MGKRALILDDDRVKAGLVSNWLEKVGIESDKVYGYDEAIKRSNIKYDYLILDYFLSGSETGSDFARHYQKKHYGCQVYMYSARPESVKDYPAIDIEELENFLQEKLNNTFPKGDTKTIKPYDIFIIKQDLDREIADLKALVARHDEKIIIQEKIQEELKSGMLKLSSSVEKFIADHNNDDKKIIFWVAGIIFTLLTIFVGIEWAIIEHLVKQVVK